jgi:hypothetical protein
LKRKGFRIKDDLLNGNKRGKYLCLPHSWLPELEKGVFQAQEGVPRWSVEEKLEGSLVKLKLLNEEKLVESLVGLKFLVEEKMDPSLVKLDLKRVEEENSPQFGSPMSPLQIISRG